jgi:hypothetical protein
MHLEDIHLADPDFGRPGRINVLLGFEIFVETLLQGRQIGPPGSPCAFETEFGCQEVDLPPLESITKRVLVSDIAKTYDVLGWFSLRSKILLQHLWDRPTNFYTLHSSMCYSGSGSTVLR